jgi:hypothetical protein
VSSTATAGFKEPAGTVQLNYNHEEKPMSIYTTTTELFGEQQPVTISYDYEPSCLAEGIKESLDIHTVELDRIFHPGGIEESGRRKGLERTKYRVVNIAAILNGAQMRLIQDEVLDAIHDQQGQRRSPPAPGSLLFQEAA